MGHPFIPFQVTAKVNLSSQPASTTNPTRSPSPFKVKAKVNTVARKSPSVVTPTPPPRAPSPSKFTTNDSSSRNLKPKARPTVRPGSASGTPQPSPSRHRPVLSADTNALRARHASVFDRSNPPSPMLSTGPITDLTFTEQQPIPRIKSKVTGMVKSGASEPLLSHRSSPAPLTQRNRTTSMASSVSMGSASLTSASVSSASPSSSPQAYPITTAVPAASPHRFGSLRASPPSTSHHFYQPFGSSNTTASDDSLPSSANTLRRRQSIGGPARVVDPTSVPLPPNSPPVSAVSFSSKSSVSYDSSESSVHVNGAITHTRSKNSTGLVNALGLQEPSGQDTRDSSVDTEYVTERKERAEAKTNRKIADLEITNTSLLAINASLESSKNKQAKEIRDLRRKLRESRLILPPRVYKEQVQEDEHSPSEDSEDDEESEEEDSVQEDLLAAPKPGLKESKQDAAYRRIKLLLDSLLVSGRKALETTPEDFVENTRKGTRVLNPDEIVRWQEGRVDEVGDISIQLSELGDDENGVVDMSIDVEQQRHNDDASLSADEAEVEDMIRSSSSPSPSPGTSDVGPPGILVTQPP